MRGSDISLHGADKIVPRNELEITVRHMSILSTCPLHTNSGCGKERRMLVGPW